MTINKFSTAMAKLPWWLQWLIFTCTALALYAPVLGNIFVNDDWLVIKRLVMDRQLNTNGFFRPLSDLTIWLNYQIGGLNAFNYYLTAVIIRGLGASLLYHFCLRLPWTSEDDLKYVFAFFAPLFFITYPFHNESVAWILGRGALIAGVSGMAALLVLTSVRWHSWKIAGACLCYFVGLAAYETIVVLPVMVLLYMLVIKKPAKQIITWQIFLWLTFGIHLIVRISVSGSLTGDYGSGFLKKNVALVMLSTAKAIVRTVFPPAPDPNVFIVLSVLLLMIGLKASTQIRQKIGSDLSLRKIYYLIQLLWLTAMLIPFWISVSTRTSESERFLEFPSYFFCMLLAFIAVFVQKRSAWLISLIVVLAFNIYFLEKNNRNWVKASAAVEEILSIAKSTTADNGRLWVIDLPGEIRGAFVFRVGFEEALLLNGVDTSRVMRIQGIPAHVSPADRVYQWKKEQWNRLK